MTAKKYNITIVVRKSGIKKYRAHPCVGGVRKAKDFDRYVDAVRWYDEMVDLLRNGGSLGSGLMAPGDMLFKDAVDRFIIESRGKVSAGQSENYKWAGQQLVESFGATARMSSVTPQDVAAHILRRQNEDEVGASVIRKEISLIRLVYTKAIDWGISLPSPELTTKRPRVRTKSREEALHRVISPEELTAILVEAKNRKSGLYNFLLFLLFTGMRPSEAASLYWDRLPAKEEKEEVKALRPVGYVDLARGGFSKVGTKTESRFVPAHPVVVNLLSATPRPEGQRLVFLENKYICRPRPYLYFRRSMETTLKNARLADGNQVREDIDFYSFRHTARSAMSNCGIATEVAETIIGHQDRSFKFTYIHLSDSDLIREMGKLQYPGLDTP